jgi:hypothetical protein
MVSFAQPAQAQSWKRIGTVSTLTNGQLCKTDGTNVICDTTTPTIASGLVGIGTTSPVVSLDLSQKTDAIALPGLGTGSGGRPTTGAANGDIRYNSGTPGVEAYISGVWTTLAAVGGAAFSGITSGTNTTATMTLGTGGTLTYSGSGVVNASTLGGATFAAPGSIGSGTAGTGAFTTLTASGLASFSGNVDATNTGFVTEVTNSAAALTAGHLVKLSGAPSTTVTAATTDTDGIIGIVINSPAGGATSKVAVSGQASCVFDNSTVAGDFVTISTGTAGDCHDAGATRPATSQTIGWVLASGSAGTYAVNLELGASSASSGATSGSGTTNYVARWTSSTALGIGALYDTGTLVSIGTTSTASMLGVYGGVSIGTSYMGTAAPANGAIIQGNVGIGTTGPTSNLYVLGGTGTASVSADTGSIATFASNSTVQLQFGALGSGSYGAWIQSKDDSQTQAYPLLLQPAGGNVGIGTTAPGAKLETVNTNVSAVTYPLLLTNVGGSNNGSGVGITFDAFDAAGATPTAQITNTRIGSGDYALSMGPIPNLSALTIRSSGNVGIGTTVPGDSLTVYNATAGIPVTIGNLSCGAGYAGISFSSSPSCSNYGFLGSSGQTFFNAPNSGIADMEFRVGNLTKFTVGNNGAAIGIAANTAPTYAFQVHTTSDFVVNSSGNVGIGTTVPIAALSIAGSSNITGQLAVGNDVTFSTSDSNPANIASGNLFDSTQRVHTDFSGDLSVDTSGILYDAIDVFSTYTHTGSGGLVGIGVYSEPTITSGSTNEVYWFPGVEGNSTNFGSGPVDNLLGLVGDPTTAGSGTVSDITGVYGNPIVNSGSVTDAYGVDANPYISGGSITGQMFGVYVSPQIGGGTVANRYGVYIDDGGGTATTDDFGIYQVATYQKNYFGGNVGIGTTSPAAGLDVYTNGAASNPGERIDGTWYTAGTSTTSKPQLLIEPAGTSSTGWAAAGTGLGVNAASGFTGNLFDFQLAGVSKASLTSAGALTVASCTGCGGGATLNGITAATASQTGIANGAYTIVWNWDALAGGSALSLNSVSTAAASNAQKMLNIGLSGVNGTTAQTTYDAYFTNTHTNATSGTNVGLYASASGATTANYAAIFAAGNVGIGTTAPSQALHVYQNTGANLLEEIQNANTAYNAGVEVRSTEDWWLESLGSGSGHTGDFIIYDSTQAAFRLVIDTSGNVGIGTTGPQSTLSVSGGVAIGTTYAGTNAAASNNLIVQQYVGIGSTSPAYPLDILSATPIQIRATSTGSNAAEIDLNDQAGGQQALFEMDDAGTAKWQFGKNSDNSFFFWDNANSKNFITVKTTGLAIFGEATNQLALPASGGVGIGTTIPAQALDVIGNIAFPYGQGLQVDNVTNTNVLTTSWNGSYDTLSLYTPGNAGGDATAKMTILGSGAVGIGTTVPTVTLDVAATLTNPAQGPIAFTNSGDSALLYVDRVGAFSQIIAAPTADTDPFTYSSGMTGWIDLPASNAHSMLNASGIQGYVTNESTTANNSNGDNGLTGVSGEVFNTGNINGANALLGWVESDSGTVSGGLFGANVGADLIGGTVQGIAGAWIGAGVNAGVVTTYGVDGAFIVPSSAGSVTGGMYGVSSEPSISGGTVSGGMYGDFVTPQLDGGALTDGLYGIYVQPQYSGGTFDSRYGIYLDTMSGGTATSGADYAIYSAATQPSYFAGKVGIGTTSPQSLLQAYGGEVQVGSSGAACSSTTSGAIRYNSGALTYCNGSAWTSTGGGSSGSYLGASASATNPARSSGELNTGLFSPASGAVAVSSLGTEMMRVNATGVGIGTASPLARSHVYGTLTSPSPGPIGYENSLLEGHELYTYPGALSQITAAPTADSDTYTMLDGVTGWINQPATNAYSVQNSVGVHGVVTNESTTANNAAGLWSGTVGALGEVLNTGNINTMNGVTGFAENDSGTVGSFSAGTFVAFLKGGSAGDINGAYASPYIGSGGSVTPNGVAGIYNNPYVDTGGSVTGGLYGEYIEADIASGATVDDRYGLYIAEGTGTVTGSDFGIYQEATTQTNYFAGNVEIGTTSPSQFALQINGTFPNGGLSITDAAVTTQTGSAIIEDAPGDWLVGDNVGDFEIMASQQINFSANASGSAAVQMSITNSGKVGIGTTVPQAALDVRSSFDVANTDYVYSSAGSGMLFSMGASSGTTYAFIQSYASGVVGGKLVLEPSGGSVGIGTTSPANKLDVNGSLAVGTYAGTASGGSNELIVSGSVGIGTTSPNYTLDVYGTAHTTGAITVDSVTGSSNATLNLTGRNSGTAANASILANYSGGVSINPANALVGINLSPSSGANLQVGGNAAIGYAVNTAVSATNGLVVSGNVGLGTTSPVTTSNNTSLTLYGTWTSSVNFGGNGAANTSQIGSDGAGDLIVGTLANGGSENLYLQTAATTRMTILSGGNVGIGTTSPANKLDVNGSLAVGTYAGTASGGSNELIVSGSVGIGTTSPGALLQIYGAEIQGSGAQLATSATTGFMNIAQTNGTPAGTPAGLVTGSVPITVDTSGNLYAWSGSAWVKAGSSGSMVYPASGIAVSTGSAWGTSLQTGTSGGTVPLLNGNNTYSGTSLFTGGVPTLANGDAAIAASATLGGIFTGQGSTNDITLENKSGTSVCTVATGTTTLNCTALQGPIGGGTASTGAFTTLTASNTVTLSPASANVAISPTGSGAVTISPVGALTISPTAASTINNTSIGATTASTGKFTTLTDTALTTAGVVLTSAVGLLSSSATLPAAEFPALTGDVTTTAGSYATTVAAIRGVTVSGTTGTTNVVFSASPSIASPTLTGTITAAAANFSGSVAVGTTTAAATTLTVAGPISLNEPAAAYTLAHAIAATDSSLIFAGTASITETLPTASSYPGRILYMANNAAFTVISNASNVVPQTSSTAGTAILPATAGAWAMLQSNGTNWVIMQSGGTGGATSLSGLTGGTGTNTIDSATNPQTWTWNTLTTGTGLTLAVNSGSTLTSGSILSVNATNTTPANITGSALSASTTSTGGGVAINGVASGATGANYGVYGSSGSSTGAGGYFTNTGTGYALITGTGNVGIGTTSPANKLDVNGSLAVGTYAGTASGGSNELIVSGSVGIGTTGPQNLLDIYGGQFTVRNGDGGPTYGSGIRAGYDGSSAPALGFRVSDESERFKIAMVSSAVNTSAERLSVFSGNGTGSDTNEVLTVNKGGNVGIGTTSPTNLLNVAGLSSTNGAPQIIVSNGAAGTVAEQLMLGYNTTADNGYIQAVHQGTAYTSLLLNSLGGSVGIGTTSPANKLDVNGSLAVGTYAGTASGGSNELIVSGSVGIGTTSPGSTLDVETSTNGTQTTLTMGSAAGRATSSQVTSDEILFEGSGYTGALDPAAAIIAQTQQGTTGTNVNGGLAFAVDNNSTSLTTAMTITSAGYVGIGTTSPANKLDVNGSLAVGTYAGTASGGSNELIVSGSVGIGTTGPTAALHVSPVAAATGTLTAERITGAANTNQTLSTEVPDVDWVLGRTVQWATGALTTQRAVRIAAPTYGFVGASTLTTAATVGITGAPVVGTNATISNTYGLLVSAGAVGAAANSYGLSVNAQTGATNNYAATFSGGNVGIGMTAPATTLEVKGTLRLDGVTYYTGFAPSGSQTASATYTLPVALPGSNMVLQSTSGGLLSWVAAGGVAGSSTDVQYNNGGVLAGNANLTFDGTGALVVGTASGASLTIGASGASTSKIAIGPTTGAAAPGTSFGACTVAAFVLSTAVSAAQTCTGIPASTGVAVTCSGSLAFTTPTASAVYARANGTANQILMNTTVANSVSMSYHCMWMQ